MFGVYDSCVAITMVPAQLSTHPASVLNPEVVIDHASCFTVQQSPWMHTFLRVGSHHAGGVRHYQVRLIMERSVISWSLSLTTLGAGHIGFGIHLFSLSLYKYNIKGVCVCVCVLGIPWVSSIC